MASLKDLLLFPVRGAGAFMKIAGRMTIGIVGFVLMGGGLLLINPLHALPLGLPLFALGLLLLVRAIF
jgi:hypothetical protein